MPPHLPYLLISIPMILFGLRSLMLPSIPDMEIDRQRATIAGCLTLVIWGLILTIISIFVRSHETFKLTIFTFILLPVAMYGVVAWWQEQKNKKDNN